MAPVVDEPAQAGGGVRSMLFVLAAAVPVALLWRALLAGGPGDPAEAPAAADVLFAAVSVVAGLAVALPVRLVPPARRVRRCAQLMFASLLAAPIAVLLGVAIGAARPSAWGVVLVWPFVTALATLVVTFVRIVSRGY